MFAIKKYSATERKVVLRLLKSYPAGLVGKTLAIEICLLLKK